MTGKEKIIWILVLVFAATALSIISVNAQTGTTGCCYNSDYDDACGGAVTLQACCDTGESPDTTCLTNAGNDYWAAGTCESAAQCQPGCCCPYDGTRYSLGGRESLPFQCNQPGTRFVQSCSDVCEEYQCSDGFDNDGDGCTDLEDNACSNEDDNSEDNSPTGCTSAVRNCDTATNLRVLSVDAEPVTGQQKIRIDWVSDCQSHASLEGFDVYRCEVAAGVAPCTPAPRDKIATLTQAGSSSYEDGSVEYETIYTYKIEGRFTGKTVEPKTDTVSMGQTECSAHENNDEFCMDNERKVCIEGRLSVPTGVAPESADCGEDMRCYDNGAATICGEKDRCEVDDANPFQIYINQRASCEGADPNRRECFYDRKYSLDSCFQCADEMKCYDYKSEEACVAHNCHQGAKLARCEWRDISTDLGTGVCVNPDEYNCEGCEPRNSKINNYNEIFGACNRQKSNMLSVNKGIVAEPWKFRCLFAKNNANDLGKSKKCDEVSCLDYTEASACVRPDDICGIRACISQDGLCVKDTDNNREADCSGIGALDNDPRTDGNQPDGIRRGCEADYFGPETIVVKNPEDGPTSSLAITIMDKANARDPKQDKTGNTEYIANICVMDCDDCVDDADASVECRAGSVQTNFISHDGRRNLAFVGLRLKESGGDGAATLIKFGGREGGGREGQYTLRISTSDPSRNTGAPATETVMVALRSSEPNINYFSITKREGENQINANGNLYTNIIGPTIKANFHNIERNARVTRAALQQGTNPEIPPTRGIAALTPSATTVNIPFSGLAVRTEYDFSFNAEDETTRTPMDRNDVCPSSSEYSMCPLKVVVDSDVVPSLTVKKGIGTLISLEATATSTILATDVTSPDTTNYKSLVPITLEFEELYGIVIDNVEITDKTDVTGRIDRKLNLNEASRTTNPTDEDYRNFNLKSRFPSTALVTDGARRVVRIEGSVWLREGEYQILVAAHDFAGNPVAKTVLFTVNALDIRVAPSEFISATANPTVELYTDNKADCTYAIRDGAGGRKFNENLRATRDTYAHTITSFRLADMGEQTIHVTCNDGIYRATRDVRIIVDTSRPEFRHPDDINTPGIKILPDYKSDGNTIVSSPKQIEVSFQTAKAGKTDARGDPILQLTFCKYRIDGGAYTDFEDSRTAAVSSHRQVIDLDSIADGTSGGIEIECRSRALPVTSSTKASVTIPFMINVNEYLHIEKISPPDSCRAEYWDTDFSSCDTNVKVSTNKKVQCDYSNNIGVGSPRIFSDTPDYATNRAYEHSVALTPTAARDYIFNVGCIDTDSERKEIQIRYNVGRNQRVIKRVDNGYPTTIDPVRVGSRSTNYRVEYPGLGDTSRNNFEFACSESTICSCNADGRTGVFSITGIAAGTCTIQIKEALSAVGNRHDIGPPIEVAIGAQPPPPTNCGNDICDLSETAASCTAECPGSCTLSSAKWLAFNNVQSILVETGQVVGGDEVELSVSGNNCRLNSVAFDIKEQDSLGDDASHTVTQPAAAAFEQTDNVMQRWIAAYSSDNVRDFGETNVNPEFKYTAAITEGNVKSGLLKVTPATQTCQQRRGNTCRSTTTGDDQCGGYELGAINLPSGFICCSSECGGAPVITFEAPTPADEATINLGDWVTIRFRLNKEATNTVLLWNVPGSVTEERVLQEGESNVYEFTTRPSALGAYSYQVKVNSGFGNAESEIRSFTVPQQGSGSGGGTGRISGRVSDSAGTSLIGVTLTATDSSSTVRGTATSGSDGTYTLSGVPTGSITVGASKTDYSSVTGPQTVEVAARGTYTQNFVLSYAGTLPGTSPGGGTGTGTITGIVKGADGAGINGANIYIDEVSAGRTGRAAPVNGVYTIQNVPAGSKSITASKLGYQNSEPVPVTVEASQTANAQDIILNRVIPLSISRVSVDGTQMTGVSGGETINIHNNNPVVSVFFNKAARVARAELQLGSNTPIAGSMANRVTDTDDKKIVISFAGRNLADGEYKLTIEAQEEEDSSSVLTESSPNRRIRIDTSAITLTVRAGRNNKVINEDDSTILLGSDGTLNAAEQTTSFRFVLEFNKGVVLDNVLLGSFGDIKGRFSTPYTIGRFFNSFTSNSQLALGDNPTGSYHELEIAAHDMADNQLGKTLKFKVNAYDFSIIITNPRYGFAIQNPFQIEIETDNDANCGYIFEPRFDVDMSVDISLVNARLNSVVTPITEKSIKPDGRYNHIIRSFNLANAVSVRYPGLEYEKDRAYKFYVRCEKDGVKKDNLFDIGIVDTTNAFEVTSAEFKPAEIYELTYTADLDVATGNRAAGVQIPSICEYSLGTQTGQFKTPFSDSYGSITQPTYLTMAASHNTQIVVDDTTANGNHDYSIECRDWGDRVARGTARLVVDTTRALSIDDPGRKSFSERQDVALDIRTNKKNNVHCEYRRVQPPITAISRGAIEAEGTLILKTQLEGKTQLEEDRLNHKYLWGLDTEARGALNLRKGAYEFEITCTRS